VPNLTAATKKATETRRKAHKEAVCASGLDAVLDDNDGFMMNSWTARTSADTKVAMHASTHALITVTTL
jgi:peroxiredoxin